MTSFSERALDQPRSLWIRRAMFQVHLWAGLAVGLYAVLIGVTGSILMFREEIEESATHAWRRVPVENLAINAEGIVAAIRKRYPDGQIYLEMPEWPGQTAKASVFGPAGPRHVFVNPYRGEVIAERDPRQGWLFVVDGLHSNLLLGRTGRLWNGIGAVALIVMTVTGMLIWWPGRRQWKRFLKIDFGARWRRLNWDLHNAIGFWTMAGILLLSVTGTWFTWQPVFRSVVGAFATISKPKPQPKVTAPDNAGRVPMEAILAAAEKAAPGPAWRLNVPPGRTGPIRVVKRGNGEPAFRTATTITVNPYTAEVMQVDRFEDKPSGDRILGWVGPLHFGNFGGLGVKLVWFVLGLVLPGLFITGFVMWWDRVVMRRWRRAGARTAYLDFISEAR